uniref:Bromo domain-containing protein n=1 Tax=Leptocylindrus danicus TaxID=163516 RepID=A0A7S2K488_9STRA|mmetsp:Transcript_17444/g.25984  ORF Transcript_17444/g.25984 Transcript_17444/m.25984 type:complete len:492 (+) Transcript_17444:519-1994(+)|eukprot:CAMPEP_0116008592 /NCGR_PEP_ID=MMETSP0321-20121206/2944_1 /TAXON_ID=163516 /ORGANISM="Leptocylindrus danicus var. danicus, Strain B650" /LENGTH=491 /DNA_ID=CAMNT_0003477423 /DNA_START=433 /DNA_END=1908 /DNA_ORIENTATION=-
MQKDEQALLCPTLERLTTCLPRHELLEIVKDAEEVEALLKIEIGRLHEKLNNAQPLTTAKEVGAEKAMTVNEMLTSFETPADKFGATVSALIGRLRKPLETPHPPHSTLIHHIAQRDKLLQKPGKTEDLESQKKKQSEQVQALLDLQKNPIFTNKMTETTALLSLWKRISGHRSANVFRRAVSERDAPGYTDKILFPVDLSLIRKMVTAGIIDSYAEFQKYIGLMSHNCVKFNGRESDYGIVAREFESYVDESIVTAVNAATEAAIKKGELETKKSLQKKEQPASSVSVSEKKKTEAPATKPTSTPPSSSSAPSSVSGPAPVPAVAPSPVDSKESNTDPTPASAPMTSILSTIPKKKTGNAVPADVSASKTKDADTKSQFQALPLQANAGGDVSAKTTSDDSTVKGEAADHAVSETKSDESTNVSATETTKGSGGNISDTSKSASEQNDTGRNTPRVSPKRKRSKPSEDEATSNTSTSTSTRRSKRGRQST